jgi:hypothetical protein
LQLAGNHRPEVLAAMAEYFKPQEFFCQEAFVIGQANMFASNLKSG